MGSLRAVIERRLCRQAPPPIREPDGIVVCKFIRRIAGAVIAGVVTPQFREWGRMVQIDSERPALNGWFRANQLRSVAQALGDFDFSAVRALRRAQAPHDNLSTTNSPP